MSRRCIVVLECGTRRYYYPPEGCVTDENLTREDIDRNFPPKEKLKQPGQLVQRAKRDQRACETDAGPLIICSDRLTTKARATNGGRSGETRTHGLQLPNLCLNLQETLLRPLWCFPALLQFLFETLLPCSFQAPLSSFGICVGLNSVY